MTVDEFKRKKILRDLEAIPAVQQPLETLKVIEEDTIEIRIETQKALNQIK